MMGKVDNWGVVPRKIQRGMIHLQGDLSRFEEGYETASFIVSSCVCGEIQEDDSVNGANEMLLASPPRPRRLPTNFGKVI